MVDNFVKEKKSAAMLSICSNAGLIVLKVIAGLAIGSVAVISEAVHSGVDLLAAVIAFLAVRTSSKPADKDHPFGHGKFENLSGTVEALLIFGAAAWIIAESLAKLRRPAPVEHALWGSAVMAVSMGANLAVSSRLFRVGRKTQSAALLADGWHLRTDVYTSAGVLVGLSLMAAAGRFLPSRDWHWVDPVVAMGVALLIIKAAFELTLESGRDLLDAPLPDEEEEMIRGRLRAFKPDVRGFHRMRTRKSGHHRFVEFHMKVDGGLTVDAAHAMAHKISGAIQERYPHTSVNIHVEPCAGRCTDECLLGCLVEGKPGRS